MHYLPCGIKIQTFKTLALISLLFTKGEKDPIEENDGVAGAIYIGKALAARGTKVTFIIDSWSDTLKECLQSQNPAFEVKSLGLNYSDDILLDVETGIFIL